MIPMNDIAAYLDEIALALVSSPVVTAYEVVRCWVNADDGYIRVRAALSNGDFLEAAEYMVLDQGQLVTADYRYQWMDGAKTTLRRRWDSTPDWPGLAGAPHHVHVEDEATVVSGRPLSLLELLVLLEGELSRS